jgi:glycyl-tRNA synthetase beta chain
VVEGSKPLAIIPGAESHPTDPSTTDFVGGPPPRSGEVLELAQLAEQAARLCKADLVTEMVGEFPELQGLMGGYYARAEGLPDVVADAIRDHYKPVGQGDEVPTAPVTVAVSLADKLDSLYAFFRAFEKPSGSRDPYALRRSALGVLSLVFTNNLRFSLYRMLRFLDGTLVLPNEPAANMYAPELAQEDLDFFFADRLKVQQREAGVRHDLIDAVFALGGEDDLVRLLARVHALQAFVGTEDGANLLAGYKRAANILKKEDWQNPSPLQGRGRSGEAAEGVGAVDQASRQGDMPHPNPSPEGEGLETSIPQDGEEDPFAMVDDPDVAAAVAARAEMRKTLSYTPEPAEKALIDALDSAEPRAKDAVAAEDFAGAMAALASLRAPIDRFFDEVTVNDQDPARRTARLDLLARFRAAVHQVADFGRIEG